MGFVGHLVISGDIASDPLMAQYRDEAEKRGYRSSASIPLYCNDRILGAMRFYSDEKNFFNEQEIQLLETLAGDVSYAFGNINPEPPNNSA